MKTKKPLLQYQRGVWYCHQPQVYAPTTGHGPTPEYAYADWVRRTIPGYSYMTTPEIMARLRKKK